MDVPLRPEPRRAGKQAMKPEQSMQGSRYRVIPSTETDGMT